MCRNEECRCILKERAGERVKSGRTGHDHVVHSMHDQDVPLFRHYVAAEQSKISFNPESYLMILHPVKPDCNSNRARVSTLENIEERLQTFRSSPQMHRIFPFLDIYFTVLRRIRECSWNSKKQWMKKSKSFRIDRYSIVKIEG